MSTSQPQPSAVASTSLPVQPQPPKVLSFTLTPKPISSTAPLPATVSPMPLQSAATTNHASPAPISFQPTSTFQLTPQPLSFTTPASVSSPLPIASSSSSSASTFTLQPKPLLTLTPQPTHAVNNGAAAQPIVAASAIAPAPIAASSAVAVAAPAAAAPAPVAVASSAPTAPPVPTIETSLAIVDDEKAYEQCLDWAFFVELVEDVLRERDERLGLLQQTLASNDHLQFQKEAHALKGAALNLHLPALVDITKKAEIVGKQLVVTPQEASYLAIRQPMLDHLKKEYARLEEVLPEYRIKAEETADGMDGEQE